MEKQAICLELKRPPSRVALGASKDESKLIPSYFLPLTVARAKCTQEGAIVGMVGLVKWLTYDFGVYEKDAEWAEVGGVYIFTGPSRWLPWIPIYVGQTDNFRNRIPLHEKWFQAELLGATHVHAREEALPEDRQALERDLIREYDPQLNKQ